jgi:DNA repair exonuclease SbcCD ATPase subunit
MSVKINSLEIENVKRIKAVKIEPAENGLTVIGGKNNQGKTSVLDSIAWALGGDKFKPSQAQRNGSCIPPSLNVKLSNGLVVERKGKNSALKVIDPNGNKGGQQLLNEFVEQLALDLPRFMESSAKEKAQTLLKIIGVGDMLYSLETQEQTLYNDRLAIGRIADQKAKYANEMQEYEGVPEDLVSPMDLIKQQQEILARNGENERIRQNKYRVLAERNRLEEKIDLLKNELKKYSSLLEDKNKELNIAYKSAESLVDESTAELEKNISDIENLNAKIRANLDKQKAEEDAKEFKRQYDALTAQIEEVRSAKSDLLKNADLPLEGLSVQDGELTYLGQKWDNMSGSQQLIVSAAIVRRLNPNCGFVLIDKLEQMDTDTLKEFGKWLEEQGLQAIATRVSTGNECSIIIEDGMSAEKSEEIPQQKTWKAGAF